MNTPGFQGRLKRVSQETKVIILSVSGMTTESCVDRIRQILHRLPGIENVFINRHTELANIRFVPSLVTAEMVIHALIEAGYSARD